jgi:hypothetical protein
VFGDIIVSDAAAATIPSKHDGVSDFSKVFSTAKRTVLLAQVVVADEMSA